MVLIEGGLVAFFGALASWILGAIGSILGVLISILSIIYDIFLNVYGFVRDIFPSGDRNTNSTGLLGIGLLFVILVMIFIGLIV